VKAPPLQHQALSSRLEPADDLTVRYSHLNVFPRVSSMKVRRRMLIMVHRDHDSEEPTNSRHLPIVLDTPSLLLREPHVSLGACCATLVYCLEIRITLLTLHRRRQTTTPMRLSQLGTLLSSLIFKRVTHCRSARSRHTTALMSGVNSRRESRRHDHLAKAGISSRTIDSAGSPKPYCRLHDADSRPSSSSANSEICIFSANGRDFRCFAP